MKINKIRFCGVLICFLILLGLTGCSCGTSHTTQYMLENANSTEYKNILQWIEYKFESENKTIEDKMFLKLYLADSKGVNFEEFTVEQFNQAKDELKVGKTDEEFTLLCNEIIKNKRTEIETIATSKVTDELVEEKYNAELDKKTKKEVSRMSEDEKKALKESIKKDLIDTEYEKNISEYFEKLSQEEKNENLELYKTKAIDLIQTYPIYSAIAGKKKESKIESNYKVILIREDVRDYITYINRAVSAETSKLYELSDALETSTSCFTGCIGSKTVKIKSDYLKNIDTENDVYRLVALFTFKVEERMLEQQPLKFYTGKEFWSHIFNNLFVFPVGWLLYAISQLCGGYYIIGLLITTLIVRTLGWPIYAKTNDMSLKMKAMEPELAKIQKKYEGKTDPNSQRMMQMEQAQLYKKHKVFGAGCLMPFLQFPIFMAVYRAIQQLPYTTPKGGVFTLDWAERLNSTVFGVDLFADKSAGTTQLIAILVLVILVIGTQFLSQKLSEKRQKEQQEKREEDIPVYRRQSYNQTKNSSQNQMQMMIYFMMLMMGMFVWQSKAGLGIYWLIGNIYSMIQTYINNNSAVKKLEKMKEESYKY